MLRYTAEDGELPIILKAYNEETRVLKVKLKQVMLHILELELMSLHQKSWSSIIMTIMFLSNITVGLSINIPVYLLVFTSQSCWVTNQWRQALSLTFSCYHRCEWNNNKINYISIEGARDEQTTDGQCQREGQTNKQEWLHFSSAIIKVLKVETRNNTIHRIRESTN